MDFTSIFEFPSLSGHSRSKHKPTRSELALRRDAGGIKPEAARDGSVQSKHLARSEDLLCVGEVGRSPAVESDRTVPC